jgi:hypothetical protein
MTRADRSPRMDCGATMLIVIPDIAAALATPSNTPPPGDEDPTGSRRLGPRSKSRPAACGLIGGGSVVEVGGRKLCDKDLFVSIAVGVGRGQDRSHTFYVK